MTTSRIGGINGSVTLGHQRVLAASPGVGCTLKVHRLVPLRTCTPEPPARQSRAMAVLSDRDIRAAMQAGRVRIDPYDATCLQPSSVDLHLDADFRFFRKKRHPYTKV